MRRSTRDCWGDSKFVTTVLAKTYPAVVLYPSNVFNNSPTLSNGYNNDIMGILTNYQLTTASTEEPSSLLLGSFADPLLAAAKYENKHKTE